MSRDYKDEYDKFQDSPRQLKKRAALNRINHNKGTYGNDDGLDVSHTNDGIRFEKSSINKGRKEKSRMKGSKRKQHGGYLQGKSHKDGGMPAIVGGKTPVELEGGEYIIRKSSVDKLGKGVLEEINKKGRIPTMEKGGDVEQYGIGGWLKKRMADAKEDRQQMRDRRAANKKSYNENKAAKKAAKVEAKTTKTSESKGKGDQDPDYYVGKNVKKAAGTTKRRLNKLVKTGKVTTPDGKKVTKKYTSKLGTSVEGETGRIRRKPQSAVQTKGGTFPVYKKKSGSAGSFQDAFKAARKGGSKTFKWDGRSYTSETAEEKTTRVAKTAADKKAKQSKQNITDSVTKAKKQYAESDVAEAQMGGMMPPRPGNMPHKAPMRTYKYGGAVSTHTPNASAGDAIAVHSHSGYKAGE